MPAPHLTEVSQQREITSFLSESECYRAFQSSGRSYALNTLWREELIAQGCPFLAPFQVQDICSLVLTTNPTLAPRSAQLAPAVAALRERYVRAISDFQRLKKFGVSFGHRNNGAALAREVVHIVAEACEPRLQHVPVFEVDVTHDVLRTFTPAPPGGNVFANHWESYVRAFEMAVSDWSVEERLQQESWKLDMESLRIHALLSEVPISWDYKLIDRVLSDLRSPVFSEAQRIAWSRLRLFHSDSMKITSTRPEGGYIGLRQNGGLEDFDSVAPSELALPNRYLYEKAFNRRLTVFERPVQRVQIQKAALCVLFDSTRRTKQADRHAARLSSSVLVRTLYELAAIVGRHQVCPPIYMFAPSGQFELTLNNLLTRSSEALLPQFCDESRVGPLSHLFFDDVSESTSAPFSSQSESVLRMREQFDRLLVLCVGPESDYLDSFIDELTLHTTNDPSLRLARCTVSGNSLNTHMAGVRDENAEFDESDTVDALVRYLVESLLKARLSRGKVRLPNAQ